MKNACDFIQEIVRVQCEDGQIFATIIRNAVNADAKVDEFQETHLRNTINDCLFKKRTDMIDATVIADWINNYRKI